MVYRSYRRPDVGAVAILADIGCLHVCRALAGRIGAVVTTGAIVDDVGMVEVSRYPGDCCMTVVAVVATGDVRGVLARGRLTVVAGSARADDLRVINSEHRYPDVRRVAIFANITRLYVCRGFARRIRAVMAAGAISRDVHVIEIRR